MNVYSLHGTGFDKDGQRIKVCCRDVFVTKAEAESKLGWFAGVIKKEGHRYGVDLSQAVIVSVLEQVLVDRGWTLSVPPVRPAGPSRCGGPGMGDLVEASGCRGQGVDGQRRGRPAQDPLRRPLEVRGGLRGLQRIQDRDGGG